MSARIPACDTATVHQLNQLQMRAMNDLWAELGASFPLDSAPQTDDEVLAAVLDAWIAGVMSSHGQFTQRAVDELVQLIDEPGATDRAQGLADRLVSLVRSATDPAA